MYSLPYGVCVWYGIQIVIAGWIIFFRKIQSVTIMYTNPTSIFYGTKSKVGRIKKRRISDPISWSYIHYECTLENRLLDRTTSLFRYAFIFVIKLNKLEYYKILLKVIGWHNISRLRVNIQTIIHCAHHSFGNSEVVRFVNGSASTFERRNLFEWFYTSKNVL